MSRDRHRRGPRADRRGSSDSFLFGGLDLTMSTASGATNMTSNSWPFATKDGPGGRSADTTTTATVSSLSSLSSVFEDEELWAEFKTELEASNLKTGLGIQGMLSKFVADKGKEQRIRQEAEAASADIKDAVNNSSSNNDNSYGRRNSGGRNNRRASAFGIEAAATSKPASLYRRVSSTLTTSFASFASLSMLDAEEDLAKSPAAAADDLWRELARSAAERAAADALQKHQWDDDLWALPGRRCSGGGNSKGVLPGRRVSVDHGDLRHGCNGDDAHVSQQQASTANKYSISPRERVGSSDLREERIREGLSRSCPRGVHDGALPPPGRDRRNIRHSYTVGMEPAIEKRGGQNDTPDYAARPNAVNSLFKEWFGMLGGERQAGSVDGSVGDRSEEKPSSGGKDQKSNNQSDSGPDVNRISSRHNSEESSPGRDGDQQDNSAARDMSASNLAVLGLKPLCVNETSNAACDKDRADDVAQDSNGLGNVNSLSEEPSYLELPCLEAPKNCVASPDVGVAQEDANNLRNVAASTSQQPSSSKPLCLEASKDQNGLRNIKDSEIYDRKGSLNARKNNALNQDVDVAVDANSLRISAASRSQQPSHSKKPFLKDSKSCDPSHSLEASKNEAMNQNVDVAVDVNSLSMIAASRSQQTHSKRPCLIKSPPDAAAADTDPVSTDVSATQICSNAIQEGGQQDNGEGTFQLLSLLLTLDCGPSKERARKARDSSAAEDQQKKDAAAKRDLGEESGEEPALESSSRSSSADSLLSGNKQRRYKPRRKHGSRANDLSETNKLGNSSSGKNLRQSQVESFKKSFVAEASDSSDNTLRRNLKSMMSTGSMMDIRKRHIPANTESRNADWTSKKELQRAGNSRSGKNPRQRQVESFKKSFATEASDSTDGSDNTLKRNLKSMMSTGSMMDIRKRHIPTNTESRNADWSSKKELQRAGNSSSGKNLRQRQVESFKKSFATEASDSTDDSDNTLKQNLKSMMSTGSMMDIRKRHIPTNTESSNADWSSKKELQRIGTGAGSTNEGGKAPAEAADESGGDGTLKLQMQSMMSTGSMLDTRKRNIPVTNSVIRNQEWSSVDWSPKKELPDPPASLQCPTQPMVSSSITTLKNGNTVTMRPLRPMPSILPNENNGNNASCAMISPPKRMTANRISTNSMLSMMSTGSTVDIRRRHVPIINSAERRDQHTGPSGGSIPNVEWGTDACNDPRRTSLNRPQPPCAQRPGNNTYLNRQAVANVLDTLGGSRGVITGSNLPTIAATAAAEMQHQGRLASEVGKGALSNRQQQHLGDRAVPNRQAALQRIQDLKKRHSERKVSAQASADNGNRDNSNSAAENDRPTNKTPYSSSIGFMRRMEKPSSGDEREQVAKEVKMKRVHPLSAAESKKKEQAPSFSFRAGRFRGAVPPGGQDPITMLEYMQKKSEVDSKKAQVPGGVRSSGNAGGRHHEEVPEEKSKNGSAGDAYAADRTDLFRRYLENKAMSGAASESPLKNDKAPPPPPRLDSMTNKSSMVVAPRGSAATSMATAAGQLLVEWGDIATASEDEGDNDNLGVPKNEDRQEPQEPYIPTEKTATAGGMEQPVVWMGSPSREEGRYITVNPHEAAMRRVSDITTFSSPSREEERCITVDPHEAAMRRVSDITTYSFEESGGMAMMDGYPPEEEEEPTAPKMTFRKKMRSLSIAEEPSEEEEFDDW